MVSLSFFFLLTSLVYSMVGFGGGSTYLALLVLVAVPYEMIPTAALICNIIVVSGGCYFFIKERHLSLKLLLPFLFTSIPFSFLGGRISVGKTLFFLLLGISLFAASLRLFFSDKETQRATQVSRRQLWGVGLPIGAAFGFLSGLTGIGGGIFLAPCLYLLGWASPRTIAASASFFILVNSIAGLFGQLIKQTFVPDWSLIFPLAIAVFVGGQIGSRLGSRGLNVTLLKKLTATLVFFVSVKILFQTLF